MIKVKSYLLFWWRRNDLQLSLLGLSEQLFCRDLQVGGRLVLHLGLLGDLPGPGEAAQLLLECGVGGHRGGGRIFCKY